MKKIRHPSVLLERMLYYTRLTDEDGNKLTREDLEKEFNVAALTRYIQEIGEAAFKLPDEIHKKYPQIAWYEIIRMRHILVHHYENVETDYIWDVVTHKAQELLPLLEKALQEQIVLEDSEEK